MKGLHIVLKGYTASFRNPLIISGTQITLPVPPYSTLLGLISCCAGSQVSPKDVELGFKFRAFALGHDLERLTRWEWKQSGLHPHSKGPGIRKREVLYFPTLDLYIPSTKLREIFEMPEGVPVLGRAQDLVKIERCREIELTPVRKGQIGPTLLPIGYSKQEIPGTIITMPEWLENQDLGYCRYARVYTTFIAMDSLHKNYNTLERESGLFHPSDAELDDEVIYIHEWGKYSKIS